MNDEYEMIKEFECHGKPMVTVRILVTGNKVSDKVAAIVCRRFRTDDDTVVIIRKFNKTRLQQLEAITVIRKFERLHEFFAIRRYG